MELEIRQVGELSTDSLVNFLKERQKRDRNAIQWRYFDEQFNAGRPRGVAAVRGGQVVGFLGLVPFRCRVYNRVVDTAWTCDWFVDSERASGATGIMLLKAARSAFDSVYHVGGNEITRHLFGRMATFSESDSVYEYLITLRIGYLINRATVRYPWIRHVPLNFARKLPLRMSPGATTDAESKCIPGVSESFVRLADVSESETGFHPKYELGYFEWFSRNPDIEVYSCSVASGASAFIWRPHAWHARQSQDEWRMAVIAKDTSSSELISLVKDAVGFAAQRGATAVKAQVSRHDIQLRQALEQSRFSEKRRLPFFAFHKDPASMPVESMSGLSYLDADNASLY